MNRDFEFEMNDVAVRMSCMTEFNGEHYIFGGDVGDPNTGDAAGWIYQMAKIDGCGLKKLPDLPFSFTQVSFISESDWLSSVANHSALISSTCSLK